MKSEYETIVIGGGPGGSATACLLGEAGVSTLLVEREQVPRFHVGESLMPETYWIFRRLGLLEKMKNSSFVKKVSVQFVSHTGRESQPFYFQEHDPRDCSQTWQVERSEFDKMLFDHAAERGVDTFDQTRVLDVLWNEERACGVRLQTADGETREIAARVVVDATGQQALVANRLQLKQDEPALRKAAIWGYYKNAQRDPGLHGGATVIMHTQGKQSWFWYIPLSEGVTSIGVVADNDYLLRDRGRPEAVFEDELVKCPSLAGRLLNAQLVSPFRVAREFSYRTSRQAGAGWVLVGDAAGFIDPIYSSGVYFALKSGELAADAIVEGLAVNDLSAAQLGRWTDEFHAGTRWIRKLVDAYYTDQFSFGRFMRDHPQHQGHLTDLLIGRIFDGRAGAIFQDMDAVVNERRSLSGSPKTN